MSGVPCRQSRSGPRSADRLTLYTCSMIKTILVAMALFVVPGVVMGLVSSYRAGQKPHRDVYLRIKKFAHRKK